MFVLRLGEKYLRLGRSVRQLWAVPVYWVWCETFENVN